MDIQEIETEQDLIKMKFRDKGYLKNSPYTITRTLNGWLYDNRHSLVFVPDKK